MPAYTLLFLLIEGLFTLLGTHLGKLMMQLAEEEENRDERETLQSRRRLRRLSRMRSAAMILSHPIFHVVIPILTLELLLSFLPQLFQSLFLAGNQNDSRSWVILGLLCALSLLALVSVAQNWRWQLTSMPRAQDEREAESGEEIS